MIISKEKVNDQFKQSGHSCVLASYAIAGNYFTGKPIEDFFTGYCDHFGLSYNSWQCAEKKYFYHFDNEWKRKQCKGYEIIIELHNTSCKPIFDICRSKFTAEFFNSTSQHITDLTNTLKTTESFLNVTFELPNKNYHSITVFYVESGLLIRDTTKTGINELSSLRSVGSLCDSVLYKKII